MILTGKGFSDLLLSMGKILFPSVNPILLLVFTLVGIYTGANIESC